MPQDGETTATKRLAGAGAGHLPVVAPPLAWYVACESRELTDEPIGRTVLGLPIALFRDKRGTAAAFLDRCPGFWGQTKGTSEPVVVLTPERR